MRATTCSALTLLLLLVGNPQPATATEVAVLVVAGLDGLVRAGRWVPVIVTIDSPAATIAGDLTVRWGDAEVRRRITIPSPGRRQLDLYLRSATPDSSVDVTLTAADRQVASVAVPVRVMGTDERVTVCVKSSDGLTPVANCTGTVTADLLPRSPRGYEAADTVLWAAGEPRLSIEQQNAYRRWRAVRSLEESGDIGLAPQPARPLLDRGLPDSATPAAILVSATYIASILLLGVAVTRRRRTLTFGAVCAIVAVAAGVGSVHAIGRVGPGSAIAAHYTATLIQIPGSSGSQLSMRGVLQFPVFDRFDATLPVADGDIQRVTADARSIHAQDDAGFPTVSGTYGLAGRQAFTAEAIVERQPLEVRADGDSLVVVNRTDHALRACRFSDAFASRDVAAMPPGESLRAKRTGSVVGPAFWCEDDAPLVAFTSPGRGVDMRGVTVIVVFDPGTPGGVE